MWYICGGETKMWIHRRREGYMCEGEKIRRKKDKKRKRQRKKREIKMILESEMYG